MGPLFEAILGGGELCSLLQEGHSPNTYAEFPGASWTPLHLAVFRCLPEVACALLQAGANPNSLILRGPPGAYEELVGMSPVDLAVHLDLAPMVALLVRHGGRPGHSTMLARNRSRETLQYELAKARSVAVAQTLVAEAVLLPRVEKAQQSHQWDEADHLLRCILGHEGEGEHTFHIRIRGLLARGLTGEAMDEASLVFISYRHQGRYLEALQVARSMRCIDKNSVRPYELEMEFLTQLGWMREAEGCFQQLLDLHERLGQAGQVPATRARFNILCRRPQSRAPSRAPEAWTVPEAPALEGSGNLPALLENESETPPWWVRLRRLWWGP